MIFIRKKIEGENSIEGFALRVASATNAVIKECPCYSTSIKGIIENLKFARREQGKINHVVAPTESYLIPFLKGKKIVTFHDLGTLYSSRSVLYRLVKRMFYIKCAECFADAFTFVSMQTKKEFEDQCWVKRRKSMVIYNTYDDRLIPNDKSEEEPIPIVLQIGTGSRKNLEATIKAMTGVNAKLLVIGKLSTQQLDLLNACGIIYENHFDVSYGEIVDAYNRSKLVSFPTFYEGFGLPVVESQVMKKPIISSDLEIIREVGGNGVYYVDPYNVDSIKYAFKNLLSDKKLYDNYVENGLENVRKFSSQYIYSQYQNLYNSLNDE